MAVSKTWGVLFTKGLGLLLLVRRLGVDRRRVYS